MVILSNGFFYNGLFDQRLFLITIILDNEYFGYLFLAMVILTNGHF